MSENVNEMNEKEKNSWVIDEKENWRQRKTERETKKDIKRE